MEAFPSASMAISKRDIITPSGKVLFKSRGCTKLNEGIVDGRVALRTSIRSGTNIFGEPAVVLFERQTMLNCLPWNDSPPFLLDIQFYSKVLNEHAVVVSVESLGAFRVSSSSWSFRLAKSQRAEFRRWQKLTGERIGISWIASSIGALNNVKMSLLRRLTYFWLVRTRDI
jgi:hypothetical protein